MLVVEGTRGGKATHWLDIQIFFVNKASHWLVVQVEGTGVGKASHWLVVKAT